MVSLRGNTGDGPFIRELTDDEKGEARGRLIQGALAGQVALREQAAELDAEAAELCAEAAIIRRRSSSVYRFALFAVGFALFALGWNLSNVFRHWLEGH